MRRIRLAISPHSLLAVVAATVAAVLTAIAPSLKASAATGGGSGDDDEDMFQSARRSSAGKTRARAFPGARDEQGLEVHASLPQPSRNPDGTAAVPSEDDEPPVNAPASD